MTGARDPDSRPSADVTGSDSDAAPQPHGLESPAAAAEQALAPDRAAVKVRQVELLISGILRIGVTASLAIIVLGTTITYLRHPDYATDRQALHGLTHPTTLPHTVPDVWERVQDLRGQGIIMLGLLVLLLTPVARVTVSIFAFMYQGDRTFVAITAAVLGVLLTSFALGFAVG